jgi:glycosyltransferase involved in cell wall biosynthesis
MLINCDRTPAVVIPTFNGARFIKEALESVFLQSLHPLRIIVVDDASTDRTREVVLEVAAKSPVPLQLVALSRNTGGPAWPMNIGFAVANAKYIATLDQDDLMDPERLAVQMDALLSAPDASACICGLRSINSHGDTVTSSFERDYSQAINSLASRGGAGYKLLDRERCYVHALTEGTLIVGSQTVFRVDAWRRVGGFDGRYRVAWDMDVCVRLLSDGPIVATEAILASYRTHEANFSGGALTDRDVESIRATHLVTPQFPSVKGPLRAVMRRESMKDAYVLSRNGDLGLALKALISASRQGASVKFVLREAAKSIYRATYWYLSRVIPPKFRRAEK